MGQCVYCGKPAGWFRSSHRACRQSCAEGAAAIIAAIVDTSLSASDAMARIESAAREYLLRDIDVLQAVRDGWAAAVRNGLQEGNIGQAEEERLDALLAHMGTSRGKVDQENLWADVEAARREKTEKAARARYREGQQRVQLILREAMAAATPSAGGDAPDLQALARVDSELAAAAAAGGLPESEMRGLALDAMEDEIERMLNDEFITAEEEQALTAVAKHFNLDKSDLRKGLWLRVVKAATLRDLMDGKVPERMEFAGHPFRLQKSEKMIWLFKRVGYSTVRTRTWFRGKTAGVSVRVARGVYLRGGGFRGHPVQEEEAVHEDTGVLGITTRHLYFAGPRRRFRIRHDRIVSIEPYSNGIGIMRDSARAKPETFEIGDGWFAYNLLQNIEVP